MSVGRMTAEPAQAGGLRRLKARREFIRASRGQRAGRPSFGLQAIANGRTDTGIGFTVTRKAGNAPERNRIKRRLRSAVTACADDFRTGYDYVLVGRREALAVPYGDLVRSLSGAVRRVHDGRRRPSRNPANNAGG